MKDSGNYNFAAMSPYHDIHRINEMHNQRNASSKAGAPVWLWVHTLHIPSWLIAGTPDGFDPHRKRYFCLQQDGRRQTTADGQRRMVFKFYPEVVLFTGKRAWEIPALEKESVVCRWTSYLQITRHRRSLVVPAGVDPYRAAGDLACIVWDNERAGFVVAAPRDNESV
jgi:hypothetical protein